ncbi:MAG TPA: glycosyltransferase family 39 protein [Chloroflexota bacterium]
MAIVAFVALLARGTAFLLLGGSSHLVVLESDHVATRLLSGQGMTLQYLGVTYHAYMSPLPPLLVAGIYLLSGQSQTAVVAFQALTGVALAVSTAFLGRAMFDARTGLLAGLLLAIHPGIGYYDVHDVQPFSVGLLPTILCVAAFWHLVHRPWDKRWWGVPGIAIGLAILLRGSLLAFLVIALAWLLVRRIPWRAVLGVACLSAVAMAIIVGPWLVRNWVVIGRPVFLSTQNMLLWVGNNPNASGGWLDSQGRDMLAVASPELKQRLSEQSDELGQSDVFRQNLDAYVLSHPGEVLRRDVLKAVYLWTWSPYLGQTYPPGLQVPYDAFNVLTGLLALAGAVIAWRRRGQLRWACELILLFALSETALRALTYVEGRHRWEIEVVTYLLTAFALTSVVVRRSTPARA